MRSKHGVIALHCSTSKDNCLDSTLAFCKAKALSRVAKGAKCATQFFRSKRALVVLTEMRSASLSALARMMLQILVTPPSFNDSTASKVSSKLAICSWKRSTPSSASFTFCAFSWSCSLIPSSSLVSGSKASHGVYLPIFGLRASKTRLNGLPGVHSVNQLSFTIRLSAMLISWFISIGRPPSKLLSCRVKTSS